MNNQEIDLEEVILGYLRSSKKIKLAKLDVVTKDNCITYDVQFEVEKGFPGNLTTPINNPFSDLFKELENS